MKPRTTLQSVGLGPLLGLGRPQKRSLIDNILMFINKKNETLHFVEARARKKLSHGGRTEDYVLQDRSLVEAIFKFSMFLKITIKPPCDGGRVGTEAFFFF